MDKEYLDFVERMGSFEFELSLEDIGRDDNIAHSNQEFDDILQHFGVKGMKWGRRKARTKSGSRKSKGEKITLHEDYINAHSRKSVKSMSDKELRDRLQRLNMEQQYERLNPSKINAGMKYANKVLRAATTTATATGVALTIYNNTDKIIKIAKAMGGR